MNIKRIMATLIAVMVMLSLFTVPYGRDGGTNADEVIELRISSTVDIINSGDVLNITVTASSLPHITRFGPVEILFDNTKADYISTNASSALPSFNYSTDTSESGKIIVSAVDEMTEEVLSDSDPEAEDFEDVSFYSEEEVVLFSLSFRILTTAEDDLNFRISGAFDFINSMKESVAVSIGEELTVPIAEVMSNDATLAALGIDGVSISPPFSSDVFDYSASVNRQVDEVAVSFIPSNSWSSVSINGGTNLQYGENLITIDVVAQDQTTTQRYTIRISKQESYTTEGAGMVDGDGKTYSFVNLPSVPSVPEGFTQTTRIINGYEVPVFRADGVSELLIYLYDGSEDPGFYFYNLTTRVVRRYDPDTTIIRSSRIVSVAPFPDDITIPDEYTEDTVTIDGVKVKGYRDTDGVFICALMDEEGEVALYSYERETGRFYDYKIEQATFERMYRYVAYFFIAATAFEAVLIVVMAYIFKKIVVDKTNPRPKHV